MPKFAKEFGGQNRNLDPKLPAKKRLPQEMIAAGAGRTADDLNRVERINRPLAPVDGL